MKRPTLSALLLTFAALTSTLAAAEAAAEEVVAEAAEEVFAEAAEEVVAEAAAEAVVEAAGSVVVEVTEATAQVAADESAQEAVEAVAVETAQEPAQETARAPKPAEMPRGVIRLDETVISGNQELPKVLYILPWRDPNGLPELELDASYAEMDVFRRLYPPAYRRELTYFESLEAAQDARQQTESR